MKKFTVDDSFFARLAEVVEGFAPRTADGKPKHAAFAKSAGISAATWNRIFHKKQKPSLEDVIKLSEKTGIQVEWLANGQGEKFAKHPTDKFEGSSRGELYSVRVSVPPEETLELWIEGSDKEMVELLKSAAEILAGKDRDIAKILKDNILSFHEKILKISSLEQRIEVLEKALNREDPPGAARATSYPRPSGGSRK